MMQRSLFSLTASIVAAGSLISGCDPGSDADPHPDGGGGPGCELWYLDADGDNRGDATDDGVVSCAAVAGRVRSHDDCDDTSRFVHPDKNELCDGIDNNCDGTIEPAGVCPAGCFLEPGTTGNGVYLVCGPLSWDDAQVRCVAHGMNLVHVDDETENKFAVDKVVAHYPALAWTWIGGTDAGEDGSWIWIDDGQRFWTGVRGLGGMAVTGVFEKWRSNEPNATAPDQDCAGAALGTDRYLWNDMSCAGAAPFICERE